MTVSIASKKQWGSADTPAKVFTTDSFSVVAGRLYVVSAHSGERDTTNPDVPTLTDTSLGITWTQIDTILPDDASSSRARLTAWRGVAGSNASGTVTVTYTRTQDRCTIVCDEFDVVDTTTTNGVVQKNSGRNTGATSLSVSLAAFGSADNATYGIFAPSYNPATRTPGTNFAEISTAIDAANDYRISTQFYSGNDTSVDQSYSDVEDTGAIVMEIKALVASTVVKDIIMSGLLPFAR